MTYRDIRTHLAAGTEEDIVRLEVTVENLVFVQELHSVGNVQRGEQSAQRAASATLCTSLIRQGGVQRPVLVASSG
jgi:hypothetical protein